MNPLVLGGWGVRVSVQDLRRCSELVVTNGRIDDKQSTVMRFLPRRFPYSSIIIDGHSGYISLRGLHWLSANKIPVFVLNFDGSMMSSILPPMSVKADVRAGQFRVADDSEKKLRIAKALVQTKIARSLQVLDWLAECHDIEKELRITKHEAATLNTAQNVPQVRSIEGNTARRYWEGVRKVIPDFAGRMMTKTNHENNASDPFNAALNYGYGLLEGECRKAINTIGLEPSVGFLHDFSDYQTKESLVYDLQEPFRWLVDVSTIQAFESKMLGPRDFYFTGDDYHYRFELEAKARFIELLRERFNSGVVYKDHRMKWDTVIQEKTSELARYFTGRSRSLDFSEPAPILERTDNRLVREKILSLTQSEAKERGIGKSTLHYLRRNASRRDQFAVYKPIMTKLA
jgi:CRISPR-associated protein Cas1